MHFSTQNLSKTHIHFKHTRQLMDTRRGRNPFARDVTLILRVQLISIFSIQTLSKVWLRKYNTKYMGGGGGASSKGRDVLMTLTAEVNKKKPEHVPGVNYSTGLKLRHAKGRNRNPQPPIDPPRREKMD